MIKFYFSVFVILILCLTYHYTYDNKLSDRITNALIKHKERQLGGKYE